MSPDTLSIGESREIARAEGPWDLPDAWTWAPLNQVTEAAENIDPRKQGRAFRYIDLSAISGGRIEDTQSLQAEQAPSRARQLVKRGDTLFSGVRVYLKNIALVDETHDGTVASTAFCVLRPITAVDPRYLYHFVNWQKFTNCLLPFQRGNSPPAVLDSDIKAQLIPLAPLNEQRRIAARIDELFAEIAEGEAALERARQGLDTWRRALLKAAVTGELTRDWREANRPAETGADLLARVRAERGASFPRGGRTRRLASSGSSASDLLPQLPEGWAWATLGECISHLTSGSRDWSQYYDQGSAIFIMAQNIRPGRYNHSYVKHVAPPAGDPETTRTGVRKNDLLVTIVGANTGDVCRVDFEADNYFVCQSVALVRPTISEISEFLEIYFVAREGGRGEFEKVIYGAGRPHLSFDQLLATRVPIPSLAEMREIVQRVRLEEEAAFSEQEFAGFHRELLALRQSILKAAFEGRLVPQDPTDEPASALLARLRNGHPGNGAGRRRARATAAFSHPSLPGLTRQSVDPRVEPAGDE